ncbi:SCO family protein [Paenibacillus sp.]|uniref:SCO family protein n=1 Tax=Paenibacillus sp. TaxID=58172 RepID=UPI002D5980C2|nr:SCO family protein [Paenibacillus sp.]HZG57592.1 SCO family protein [Paenibacillus sp.]
MNGFWRKHWYKLTMAGVSVVLLAAIGYVYFGGEKEPPFPMQGPAAPFTLTDTAGEPVTMEKSIGQVKLLYFFFANCPDVCPPTSHMLSRVQDRLVEEGVFGDKALIYQVTIDPERDTAENLAKYAANMNADTSGWKFLRGTVEETQAIADDYGILYRKDEETGFYIHANVVLLIDGDNQIRKKYSTDDLNDELIAKDVMKLINS